MYSLLLPVVVSLPVAQESLPDAEELLARHRKLIGTPEALAAVENVTFHGKQSWEGLEGDGFVTEVHAGLSKARSKTEFAVFGTYETGCDGAVVWEKSPLGVVVRDGWDASQYMRMYGTLQNVDWKEMYERARCTRIVEVEGRPCHELQMTPRPLAAIAPDSKEVPTPDAWYLDVESGMLRRFTARSLGLLEEPAEMTIDLEDWREVDGVRYAHRVELEVSGFTLVDEYTSIEHNADLPEGYFEVDEEVRAEMAKLSDSGYEDREREPTLKMRAEGHIASIRVQCGQDEIQKTLTVLLPEAMQTALAAGAVMDGQPLVRYHSFGATIDLEAAIPVTAPIEARGRVKPETLPAGLAVVAWHIGPYHTLGETHEKIMAFMDEQGYEQNGAAWEQYWTDPGMEPDPSKWRTEVVWPVKKKE